MLNSKYQIISTFFLPSLLNITSHTFLEKKKKPDMLPYYNMAACL